MLLWIGGHVWCWRIAARELEQLPHRVGLRPENARAALERLGGPPWDDTWQAFRDGVVPWVGYAAWHPGPVGVVFDCLVLWALGRRLESSAGSLRFLLLVLLGALAGGLAQHLLEAPPAAPIVGGAGVVAATLGAYLMRHASARVRMLVPVVVVPVIVTVPASVVALAWLAAQWHPVQTLLVRGASTPLGFIAVGVAFAVGFVGSLLLYPRRGKASAPKKKR